MNNIASNWLYKNFDPNNISKDICFLCLEWFSDQNKNTKEHVIPKWIIRDFNLKDDKIIYQWNAVNYTHYVIPCCYNCHQKYLNPIEEKISSEFKKWFGFVKKIDPNILYLRLCKIIYWLMWKKQFLTRSKRPVWELDDDIMIPSELLEEYRTLYLFLQMYKFNFDFTSKPYSIFLIEIEDWRKELQFYFRDNLEHLFITMQLWSIWIICVYQDNWYIYDLISKQYGGLLNRKMHPFQFVEFSALIQTHLVCWEFVPKYITSFHKEKKDFITINPYWYPRNYQFNSSIFHQIFNFALKEYSDFYFHDEWIRVKRPEMCWFIDYKDGKFCEVAEIDKFINDQKNIKS